MKSHIRIGRRYARVRVLRAAALALVLALSLGASSCGRKSQFTKSVSIRNPTPEFSAIQRFQRHYQGMNLESTLSCLCPKRYAQFPRAEGYLLGLFRRARELRFSIYRGLVDSKPRTLTWDVTWQRRYVDIYSGAPRTKKGRSRITLSRGPVPHIIDITGDDIFSE